MNFGRWDSTMLDAAEEVQTFVDDLLIASVQDVKRSWHTPLRKQEQPLITEDRPWEHVLWTAYYGSTTVLRDPADGLFKCWYQNQQGAPAQGARGGDRPPANFNLRATQLYACSPDGLIWEKPELDVRQVGGRKSNIVLGGGEFGDAHAMTVVLDPHPPRREERFRAMLRHLWSDASGRQRQTHCVHSPDGIHWRLYDEIPRFGRQGNRPGDVNLLFYDPEAREFVVNIRAHLGGQPGAVNLRQPRKGAGFLWSHQPYQPLAMSKRRIWQSRSSDFLHWSDPVLVATPDDDEYELDVSYYGMSQFRLGSLYLATVGVFHQVDNLIEVQLLMSRDGLHWQPTKNRRPFLQPRGAGHWDAYMVSLFSQPIDVGDEHWFYQGGFNYHHDWWLAGPNEGLDHAEARHPERASAGLGLVTLRRHGFAALEANRLREGIVVTHPVLSDGNRLQINARCRPGGSVRVEVADRSDTVIGGCAKDDCDAMTGDSVAHTVTWNGRPELPASARESANWRSLRFFLRDAELYSFCFQRGHSQARP